jgi:hypothetical protein
MPETIGINTPLKYTFQRDTTCSPLLMDDRFIKRLPLGNETYKIVHFRYFYGNSTGRLLCTSNFVNCTFELPISGVDPQYSV